MDGDLDMVSESGSHYKSQLQMKRSFPPHIHTLMYGEMDELPFALPYTGLVGTSFVSNRNLQMIFSKKPAPPIEQQHHKPSFQTKKKPKKEETEVSDGSIHKYRKFNEIVSRSRFGKIQFKDVGARCEVLPNWVLLRLENACRSFRYELPFNKKLLEEMSPVQFLASQTRLTKDQRKRYMELYKKFKNKYHDGLEFKNLHQALNTMLGSYFSLENFDVLCTCLFISEETSLDSSTFIGVCAFTDRLFWTAYLEFSLSSEDNTFSFWAPNRSALEFADFENLKRKLSGVQLSREMDVLLHSLA